MLKKQYRLAKTRDIKTTFARGRGFFNPMFSVRFRKNFEQRRFTVVVSSRVSKKAVVRNRIKRKVREFIRTNLKMFVLGDYVVEIKPRAVNFPEKEILSSLEQFLIQKKIFHNETD